MRTGIATVPLDTGRCPKWLFERMKRLSKSIILVIREEFGQEELLKRVADPTWFQSLGCVIGFDWNSSGLTTTTMGALKEGIRGIEKEVGIFICGGKGKTSRKTPDQIQDWAGSLGWSQNQIDKLIYASRISAKVDSSCVQDGFQIYHHNFIFTNKGSWAVVQQGMNTEIQKARRYHWLSSNLNVIRDKPNFIEEPHAGIISQAKVNPLNLTARESDKNRQISRELAGTQPKSFLRDVGLISNVAGDFLMRQKRLKGFTEVELNNIEFNWHPVANEKFDLKRLEKTIFAVSERKPRNFEELVSLEGVGPRTIRALSLVAELIYGAKPSYEDPARYTFAHGGKDGTPYPVNKELYDRTLEVLEKGIKKSALSLREKEKAQRRLLSNFNYN